MPGPPNFFEVVTAECDIVTLIHKIYRPDPTATHVSGDSARWAGICVS